MPDALAAIEESGVYSNGGPVVSAFEREIVERLYDGRGAALAVANATVGLMIAIRQAAGRNWRGERFAMMPSFTFAATAHAAEWAGLTPLLIDSDPDDWAASAAAEEDALRRYGDRIAVVVPYATFGNCIDLDRYRVMAERHAIGVVVDAAASLGALDVDGLGFGAGAPFATIFSMHATKTFATAEGGLIYCGDADRVADLRHMANFGFGEHRLATMPGLNAKMPEVLGLLAAEKLADFDRVAAHRAELETSYRERLGGFTLQRLRGKRPTAQFQTVLLPRDLAERRDDIVALLGEAGVGAAHYFSPHLAQQPYFRDEAVAEPTPVADDIGARCISLPLHDAMSREDVATVCDALVAACEKSAAPSRILSGHFPTTARRHRTLVVGGGPAGIALLTAAAKNGKLEDLARAGLTLVEHGSTLGGGMLGEYAIRSDSTAETFLSAVKDSPYPSLAALAEHPGGVDIARYRDALGVPLARTPPFLRALGDRLAEITVEHGANIAMESEVLGAQRVRGGGWRARIRDRRDGSERELLTDRLVIATGGYQCTESIADQRIDGVTLRDLAGDRLVPGDEALRLGGIERLRERLSDVRAPKIAVIGASTSAVAAVTLLLKANPAFALGQGAITLLHRQKLRPFYPSAEAAHADGFDDFGPDDICPVSGFVYRLGGFRLEARELVLRMLGIGGRAPDPRLALHHLGDADPDARRIVADADIVIGALGYRPRALPLFDTQGNRIALAADAAGRPRLVDQRCRVIDARGKPLPGAFGIGLAAGFVPEGQLGGERSFRGKANGLWLWQNDVGLMIVDQLLEEARRAAA
ncbi:DegT/DnrJ/EryC1/StrS family aminotransferase [Stakelama marina]|nr:DegT/DnrJ/EryC1/StrS family aminotransferase [Stakelama marina]